jgi:hypothetical protein
MPYDSRVWIYQSNRELSVKEEEIIAERLTNFINNWQRHGDDLKGSFLIKYHHFIILFVDENFNNVSGCSIDASVNVMKQFEKDFNIDLTNKMNISFKDFENINVVSMNEFKKYAADKKITEETIVFNNMVTSKEGFEKDWEVKAIDSWHKRFLAS